VLHDFIKGVQEDKGLITYATDVAQAIWQTVTDPATPLRVPAGADAQRWMAQAGA